MLNQRDSLRTVRSQPSECLAGDFLIPLKRVPCHLRECLVTRGRIGDCIRCGKSGAQRIAGVRL
jgi:hypothetical protein